MMGLDFRSFSHAASATTSKPMEPPMIPHEKGTVFFAMASDDLPSPDERDLSVRSRAGSFLEFSCWLDASGEPLFLNFDSAGESGCLLNFVGLLFS